jgi:hypothetical protein
MLTAGVGMAKVHVYVGIAPPAPIVETRPPMPGPGYVWVPGYHNWNGSAYVWTGGHWMTPPHAHARYLAGRWHHAHRGWYYEEGRWR